MRLRGLGLRGLGVKICTTIIIIKIITNIPIIAVVRNIRIILVSIPTKRMKQKQGTAAWKEPALQGGFG